MQDIPQSRTVAHEKSKRRAKRPCRATTSYKSPAQHWKLLEPLLSCSADMFVCPLEKVQEDLQVLGMAVIKDSVLRTLAAEAVPEASAFIKEKGSSIFQQVLRDEDGEVVLQKSGRPFMLGKNRERVQARIRSSTAPATLLKFRKYAEALLQHVIDIIQAKRPEPLLRIRKRVLLGTRPMKPRVEPQALHIDVRPGVEGAFVVLFPMVKDTTLLIAQNGSHNTTIAWRRLTRKGITSGAACTSSGAAAAGGSVPNNTAGAHSGAATSSKANMGSDSASMSSDSGEDSDPACFSDGTAEKAALALPKHKIRRLVLQPGQALFVHGNTVHAGDAGKEDCWIPRLHMYVLPGQVKDRTYPVETLPFNDKFERKFGPWEDE